MERRPTLIVRTGGSPRGRLTRALAFLVLALTTFPFTAPCPVCDLAAVVSHPGPAPALPVRLAQTPGFRVSPAPPSAVEWTLVGEEPGDHDVLLVDRAADATVPLATALASQAVRAAHPRAAAFLRAAPLRL